MSAAPDRNCHPFPFATHPRVLDRALRSRRLGRDEYAVLVALYARANRTEWSTSITLDQLAEIVAWDRKLDTLYRLLAGLKKGGWIAYPTKPGRKSHVYLIELLFDRPRAVRAESEDGGSAQSEDRKPGERLGS